MQNKESLIETYRLIFPDWTDEQIEMQARFMMDKYATVKHGDMVVHLEYYSGIISEFEIKEIELTFRKASLELSYYDRTGVPFASLEDYTLHFALFLNDSIVQNVVLGLGTNALWDAIKNVSVLIWSSLKKKRITAYDGPAKKTMNFGLSVKIDSTTFIDLKFDGEGTEDVMHESLDKIIDLIKAIKSNEASQASTFYIFDKNIKNWKGIDRMVQFKKMAERQRSKRKEN